MSALSCMSALCLYFLLHWKLLSSGQIPSCACKHTCNKALLILIIVFFKCCHHVPQYMAFCWLASRLHSIQCQMIICDYKKTTHKTEVSRNTSKHTHTHTHTHVYLAIQMGTFHRRNGFYTVQTVCAIALHLNLALTGNILHFYNFKKTLFSLFLNPFYKWGRPQREVFGDFVRFTSLLGTNLSPKYG